ncbi:uncharacterized protein LOC129600213 [Paramacrobiotus metropolitanus]|uniref:uncharacterized protein LOC129600213 n=1 Tax=Paramacrobiotus metropolitanus TaxID=2943436 RepID=UPI0024457363|nr:uncharacterized protein LOC129600213 [Paramacrobiotus metropolitanus]
MSRWMTLGISIGCVVVAVQSHRFCKTSNSGMFRCQPYVNDNMDIPRTFDVDIIPDTDNVTSLVLYCDTVFERQPGQRYCTLLRNEHRSIPARRYLTRISLYGFFEENGQRPPFRHFLQHVRNTTEELAIQDSKISYLDAHFFAPFRRLRSLDLSSNDIYDIALDSFQPLQPVAVDGSLNLAGNALQEMGLAVFKPLASWLSVLGLYKQHPPMRKLHMSGPRFEFPVLSSFHLGDNAATLQPEIFDSMPNIRHLGLYGSEICDVCDCSCCEAQPFLQRLSNFTGSGRTFEFQCSWFKHYDPGEFAVDYSGLLKSSPCPRCVEPDPVDILCQNGSISSSDPNPEETDSLLIRFTSDAAPQCTSTFHDLYQTILDLGNVTHPEPGSSAAVTLFCRANRTFVWGPDVSIKNPLKVIVDTDLSPHCHHVRVRFLKATRHHISNEAIDRIAPSIIPIQTWIKDHLVCPLGAPLFVNCTNGTVVSYPAPLNQTKSTILHIRSDLSLVCQEFVKGCHKYLLEAEGVTVQDYAADSASQDVVAAVCQRGRIILSGASPKRHLTYYAAPNDPCQRRNRAFLNHIQPNNTYLT